jgi:hypothetical protein
LKQVNHRQDKTNQKDDGEAKEAMKRPGDGKSTVDKGWLRFFRVLPEGFQCRNLSPDGFLRVNFFLGVSFPK